MHRGIRALMAAVALAAFAVGGSGPALAHAVLDETAPNAEAVLRSAPRVVGLAFSEPVDPELGGVRVFAPDGERADRGRVTRRDGGRRIEVPIESRGQGTYTVAWSVVSDDSHEISGSFVFSVGRVTGAAAIASDEGSLPRAVAGASRWAAFAGTLGLFGSLGFAAYSIAGIGMDDNRRRRLWRLGIVTAALVLGGATVNLIAQTALASGRSLLGAIGVVPDAVTGTRFGAIASARVVFAVVAFVAVLRFRDLRRPIGFAIVAVAAVGLAVTPALIGHAWTVNPRWLSVPIDTVHVGAAGVWIGGLVALLLVVPRFGDGRLVVRRFSRLALVAAAVVVATGSVSSWLQVRSVDALTGTGYGKLLIVKVAAVAAILALGWYNRARLIRLFPDKATLLNLVRIESGVALVVVVGITSVLVNRPPARSDLVRPYVASVPLSGAGGDIELRVEPARAGANDVHMYFFDDNGAELAVDAVELSVGRRGVPPRNLQITPVTRSHVSAYAATFPSPGTWTLTVTAVRDGERSRTTTQVRIR